MLPSLISRTAFGRESILGVVSKCLSKSAREAMIKYVLKAIPSYVMSIFQLSSLLITTIERMMNSFWWILRDGKYRPLKMQKTSDCSLV